jgi:hypothetical protein
MTPENSQTRNACIAVNNAMPGLSFAQMIANFGLISKLSLRHGQGGNVMLSCTCYDGYGDWWYLPPNDFTVFHGKRRKRCCSCGKLIEIGSQCAALDRYRFSKSYVEENIYGDEVPLAYWYLCEPCAEIFFNLNEVGYCYYAGDDLREYLREYWERTGFKAKEDKE